VRQRDPIRIGPPLSGGNLGLLGCSAAPFKDRLALLRTDDRITARQPASSHE
jgi:hypothetical protein